MGETNKQTRQALYRKYRSKSLDEIVGQSHITKTLANAIKQGKISHAYLFTGPRGTGKTSIARILAHEINGLPYTDDSTHLDIIEIDAASNRRIDDIRDLRDKVHIAPLSAKYKVYIIDEVHMLTTESFNALLKTLEEPPEHVVFILATTEVHKLPATIISRTQRHSFKSIPSDQVAEHLGVIAKNEKIKVSDDALELLAKHGNGSFRDSISLLDQLSTHDVEVTAEVVESLLGIAPTTQLKSLLTTVQSGDTKAVLEIVDTLIQSGLTPSGIANQLAHVVRDEITLGKADHEMVALLGRLLEVHSAIYKQLKLESILLSATMARVPETQKAVVQPPKTSALVIETPKMVTPTKVVAEKNSDLEKAAPASKVEHIELPQQDSVKKSTKTKTMTPVADDFDINTYWPEILGAIKTKNNPLYTVLRLAHISVNGSELLLTFSFPFHQKRVDDLKNKIVIAETVQDITGHNFEVETLLNKDLSPPEPVKIKEKSVEPDPAHASVIAGVQDIMGGGEVVNV